MKYKKDFNSIKYQSGSENKIMSNRNYKRETKMYIFKFEPNIPYKLRYWWSNLDSVEKVSICTSGYKRLAECKSLNCLFWNMMQEIYYVSLHKIRIQKINELLTE